jgi:hypothetical protein
MFGSAAPVLLVLLGLVGRGRSIGAQSDAMVRLSAGGEAQRVRQFPPHCHLFYHPYTLIAVCLALTVALLSAAPQGRTELLDVPDFFERSSTTAGSALYSLSSGLRLGRDGSGVEGVHEAAQQRAALKRDDSPEPKKHIDWYCGGQGGYDEFALNSSSPGNQADLVDGILPCSASFIPINCATGRLADLNQSKLWVSGFADFLRAGKEVNVQISGGPTCCVSETNCPILKNKKGLAGDLLELALQNNLTGFTQDWEFGAAFHWDGIPLQHFIIKFPFNSLPISASLRNYYGFPVKI